MEVFGVESENHSLKARVLIKTYINERRGNAGNVAPLAIDNVYIVWFSKTLQNWKALVCTNLPDEMYYEVTHNGNKNETYIDAYQKIENVVIPD